MANQSLPSSNVPTVIWEKPEPQQRAALTRLNRKMIVEAAIGLADRDGLTGLSLRTVGASLNSGPMRLYAYISSKDELLDLMVDAMYEEMLVQGPFPAEWREAVCISASRMRQTAQRHGWFAEMLGGRPHQGPCALAFLEATLAILNDSGLFSSISATLQALRTIQAFIIGAIQSETRERRAEHQTGLTKTEWQLATGPYMQKMIETGRFPTIAKLVKDASHPDPDTVFEVGLECVLDGIHRCTTFPTLRARRSC